MSCIGGGCYDVPLRSHFRKEGLVPPADSPQPSAPFRMLIRGLPCKGKASSMWPPTINTGEECTFVISLGQTHFLVVQQDTTYCRGNVSSGVGELKISASP